jgi:antibiotic biosynthesis monooxygenase (ABM) superfamily enzyme
VYKFIHNPWKDALADTTQPRFGESLLLEQALTGTWLLQKRGPEPYQHTIPPYTQIFVKCLLVCFGLPYTRKGFERLVCRTCR